MIGGLGNDTYVVDVATDVISETSTLVTEVDTVQSSVSWTLGANLERLILTGSASVNGTGNGLDNIILASVGNNILNGGAGTDTASYAWSSSAISASLAVTTAQATGGSGSDTLLNFENLTGSNYNDRLTGNAAANLLNGGSGSDTLIGGLGNDTYVVDVATDVISETSTLVTEIDTVQAAVSWTLGSNLEKLILTGSAVNGTGNGLANTLTGNNGANVLNGGSGSDTLVGGLGNDTYVVDVATDVISETSTLAAEIDTVQSAVTWTLGANLEKLVLTGSAAINGNGNILANTLTGNSAANVLNGGAGNDVLSGKLGADSLVGGTGNDDYMYARGDGSDTLIETDATASNSDRLIFSGVNHDQLWFRSVGNNLEVSVIGTTDKVSITNWNLGSANHVEQFRAADGRNLSDAQVANLINAMAAFAPPVAGQTSLPANYHAALDSVIAANWH